MLSQRAHDWVRRWSRIGTVKRGRFGGIVVNSKPCDDPLAQLLLTELERTPGLEAAISRVVLSPLQEQRL